VPQHHHHGHAGHASHGHNHHHHHHGHAHSGAAVHGCGGSQMPVHCQGGATAVSPAVVASQPSSVPYFDLDSETDSNHDTALTLACAGGHDDLVKLLITRGADIGKRS
jgi:ankyrin repeat domain-containing protein 17